MPRERFGFVTGSALDLGRGATPLQGGQWLDSHVIVQSLHALDSGFHSDPGARLNIYHPEMDEKQGLYYWSKHVASMDRGMTPQWPEWWTKEELVPVSLDYALRHEDFPVLDIKPGGDMSLQESDTAYILRPRVDRVRRIGWAEVFWRVLNLHLPHVRPWHLAAAFRVPMAWCGTLVQSPLSQSFQDARARDMAA